MSRAIKFRAWYKTESRMLDMEELCFIRCGSYDSVLLNILDGDTAERFDLMQFTGLHDRNGVEIYEGDIVAHENVSDIEQVYFNTTEACFACKGSSSGESWLCDGYMVIGNIHQHPKLMGD